MTERTVQVAEARHPDEDPITNPSRTMSANDSRKEAAVEAKHKIFLSHSGAQKAFVEQLCVDLERCDRHPFFDKRRHSLGIGVHFPKAIFQAIRQCQVGVLILSEDFFTRTKWPMLEMAALVETKKLNPELVIMPVFLGISREQCRNADNHGRWRSTWLEWAQEDPRINLKKWQESLSLFGPTNGLVYNSSLGEVKFRQDVVEVICERVRPETRWDDSHVQGRTRLCKVIREKVERTQVCKTYGARVVGLHGVGGIGKTTICKVLCNDYSSEFRDKVAHVEMESGSEVELMRKVLRKLTDVNPEVLAGFDTGECTTQLKAKVHKHNVFLAIDNVSDSVDVIDQAMAYLRAGFKQGSVVIVTARSLEQLIGVGIAQENCLEMPKLDAPEARSVFLRSVPSVPDEISKEDEALVMHCVELCRFLKADESSFDYLPLALKVLGVQLGCFNFNPTQWVALVEQEPDTFNRLRERQHPIFALLRRSFDALRDDDQLLFMDAVLYFPKHCMESNYVINIFEWLSMVHRTSVQLVKSRLEALKRKSVIEELGERIGVHDLWREFAEEETKSGQLECRRWVYVNDDDRTEFDEADPSGNRWGKLRRMCFIGTGMESFKHVNLQYCSNVTVLHLTGYLEGVKLVDLTSLKFLKSLLLYNWHFVDSVEIRGLGSLMSLGLLVWEDKQISSACMDDISLLTNLQVLRISCRECSKMPDLTNLKLLQVVQFDTEGEVSTLRGLSYKLTRLQRLYLRFRNDTVICGCYGICNIIALQELEIEGSVKVEEVFSLRKLTNLQRLTIDGCQTIKALPGLDDSVSLTLLHLLGCDCDWECSRVEPLRLLPQISMLTNLQKLNISRQSSITALEGLGDAVSLQEIQASHCYELRELPDIHKLRHLRELDISWCSVKTVPGLGDLVALQVLRAQHCAELTHLPDMRNLSNLKTLDIRWSSLRRVQGLNELAALEHLFAHHCAELVELPDMSKLTNLRVLDISHSFGLQALPPLGNLTALQNLKGDSQILENTTDLHQIPHLLKLKVTGWSAKGLPGSSQSLQFLTIRDCRDLDEIPGVPHLPNLQWLKLKSSSFRNVSGLQKLPSLLHLEIFFCSDLGSVPDLLNLTRLTIVHEENTICKASLGVVNIGNLPKLEYLKCQCLSITEFADLSKFPRLVNLEICDCGELARLTSSEPLTALKFLTLERCARLRALPELRGFTGLDSFEVRDCGIRLTEPDSEDGETTSWPRLEWEPVPTVADPGT